VKFLLLLSPQGWQSVQVTTAVSNFGEVTISHFKMLSSKEILVFNPPQRIGDSLLLSSAREKGRGWYGACPSGRSKTRIAGMSRESFPTDE
jgi:hypothetical protein